MGPALPGRMWTKLMEVTPAAYSIADAAKYIGIGKTKIYELINSGVLPVVHFGKRSVVRRVDLDALLIANQHHATKTLECG